MRREGCDENNLEPGDFLCDFCENTWADDRPMVEGHRGSLICAKCLNLAYDLLWNHAPVAGKKAEVPHDQRMPGGLTCRMCLESREEPCWHSPVVDESWICKRCAKQSVVMLERDPEVNYKRPAAAQ
jgi:hypothetical protein